MKLSRLIGEEAQSPGLGLALELLVLVLVGVFVGLKADLLVGVASVLALDSAARPGCGFSDRAKAIP